MAIFLSEDEGKKLKNKQIPIPKGIQKELKSNLSLYGGYGQTDGYKRLHSLVDDDYNKRSSKSSKTNDGGKTLSFADAKRIDHDMRHMAQSPKNLEYRMLGGDKTRDWLHNALGSIRSANKQVQKVPQVPKLQKTPTKVQNDNNTFKYGNATVRITESSDDEWLPYFDYANVEENVSNVLEEFSSNREGKESWTPLINPEMYQKALSEFTQYGKFIHFPTKYVYSWMGILMRNTAKLYANTVLAGHESWFPTDTVIESIENYPQLREVLGIDEDCEVSDLSESDFFDLFESAGLYDWMECPDGSEAWSDFGIKPIEKLLVEYHETSTPEETIVIINKVLDVYHCRGDLASIFIEGGSKTLSKISEETSREKTVIITESQLQTLKEYHDQLILPFDGVSDKMNIEHYIDFLEDIGRFGQLESQLGKDRKKLRQFLEAQEESAFSDWQNNFDLSVYDEELTEEEEKDLYYSKLQEYGFPERLQIDENGLIYCERALNIPSPMQTANDSQFYKYKQEYGVVGEFWTWHEGRAEAYCASSGETIVLIGKTRPEDVDWIESFTRNAYELNDECELYIGVKSLVQIEAIQLDDRTIRLPRPIVVPTYAQIEPKEILKSLRR